MIRSQRKQSTVCKLDAAENGISTKPPSNGHPLGNHKQQNGQWRPKKNVRMQQIYGRAAIAVPLILGVIWITLLLQIASNESLDPQSRTLFSLDDTENSNYVVSVHGLPNIKHNNAINQTSTNTAKGKWWPWRSEPPLVKQTHPTEKPNALMRNDFSSGIRIVFHNMSIHPVSRFHYPRRDRYFDREMNLVPDYGGLNLSFFDDIDARRTIYRDLEQYETKFRPYDNTVFDDDMEIYYFDDDYLRGYDTAFNEDGTEQLDDMQCRKVSEHRQKLENCNRFHEVDRLDPRSAVRFINAGAFREVFGFVNYYGASSEVVAIKDISYDHDMKYDDYEYVRMDATVAELLSNSPRIYDIYGYCGLGIISEFFSHGDLESVAIGGDDGYMSREDLNDTLEAKPQNNFTGIEKLVLCLEMAEALADLHGHSNALIIHDDVQLSQFLMNHDKTTLKLNDFNRAEFPLFDEKSQQYCRYKNGRGHGNWRSPEEYKDMPLTEQIDVWSLGNNMLGVLTGLNPLHDVENNKHFRHHIIDGVTAGINPLYANRSEAERHLTRIIPTCFSYKPEDRPSIFTLVTWLQEAVNMTLPKGTTRQDVLKGLKTKY